MGRQRGPRQEGEHGAICSSRSGWSGWMEQAAAERWCPVLVACRNFPQNDKTGLPLQILKLSSSSHPSPCVTSQGQKNLQPRTEKSPRAKPNCISFFLFPTWTHFPNGHSDGCGEQPSPISALPVTTGILKKQTRKPPWCQTNKH